jgi:hypothetical protein
MNRENNKRLKKCLTIDICYYPEEKKTNFADEIKKEEGSLWGS